MVAQSTLVAPRLSFVPRGQPTPIGDTQCSKPPKFLPCTLTGCTSRQFKVVGKRDDIKNNVYFRCIGHGLYAVYDNSLNLLRAFPPRPPKAASVETENDTHSSSDISSPQRKSAPVTPINSPSKAPLRHRSAPAATSPAQAASSSISPIGASQRPSSGCALSLGGSTATLSDTSPSKHSSASDAASSASSKAELAVKSACTVANTPPSAIQTSEDSGFTCVEPGCQQHGDPLCASGRVLCTDHCLADGLFSCPDHGRRVQLTASPSLHLIPAPADCTCEEGGGLPCPAHPRVSINVAKRLRALIDERKAQRNQARQAHAALIQSSRMTKTTDKQPEEAPIAHRSVREIMGDEFWFGQMEALQMLYQIYGSVVREEERLRKDRMERLKRARAVLGIPESGTPTITLPSGAHTPSSSTGASGSGQSAVSSSSIFGDTQSNKRRVRPRLEFTQAVADGDIIDLTLSDDDIYHVARSKTKVRKSSAATSSVSKGKGKRVEKNDDDKENMPLRPAGNRCV